MKLKDLGISVILQKIYFSEGFISKFKEWCSKRPSNNNFFGLHRKNPFLALIPKSTVLIPDTKLPVPTQEDDDVEED